jgi:hypothetical protein
MGHNRFDRNISNLGKQALEVLMASIKTGQSITATNIDETFEAIMNRSFGSEVALAA